MSREDVLKKVINIYSDIVEENTGESANSARTVRLF